MKNLRRRKELKKFPLMDEFYDEFEFENAIIETIKETRKKQGFSHQALADKIGIHKTALVRYETGRASNPTLTFLKKLLIGLGLKITISRDTSRDPFVI